MGGGEDSKFILRHLFFEIKSPDPPMSQKPESCMSVLLVSEDDTFIGIVRESILLGGEV